MKQPTTANANAPLNSLTLETIREAMALFKKLPNPFEEMARRQGGDLEKDILVVPEAWFSCWPELERYRGTHGVKPSRYVSEAYLIFEPRLDKLCAITMDTPPAEVMREVNRWLEANRV